MCHRVAFHSLHVKEEKLRLDHVKETGTAQFRNLRPKNLPICAQRQQRTNPFLQEKAHLAVFLYKQ